MNKSEEVIIITYSEIGHVNIAKTFCRRRNELSFLGNEAFFTVLIALGENTIEHSLLREEMHHTRKHVR